MKSSTASPLPPGPSGRWIPTLKLIKNPRKAIESWRDRYGDPFLMNALNGPVVVTGREDLLKTIHGQDPEIYEPFGTIALNPMMGSGSMLALSGERHRRERKLMMPMFHGDRMKAYGDAMQAIAREAIAKVGPGASFQAVPLLTGVALNIIVRTIFGASSGELVSAITTASRQIIDAANPLLFFSARTHRSFFGWSPWDRWNRAKARLFALLDQIIDSRRDAPPADDILSLLCQTRYESGEPMSREDIHSELLTFLFAGHETSSLAMSWAMYHLHRNADALEQLRGELDALPDQTPASLATSRYLRAVVQETLRIHPIVTETLRKLKTPLQLGDYLLPVGMGIAPATVLAHHNPATYPEPEAFLPRRFLEHTYNPFQYMPFGGGHRRCIGAAFAQYEITIVLGTLLAENRFELRETRPVVPRRRNITIGPSRNILLRYVGPRT